MSLKFINNENGQYFEVKFGKSSFIWIHVSNEYINGHEDETEEEQLERIKNYLLGKGSDKTILLSNDCNESELNINFEKDIFYLSGGEPGPSFGFESGLTCSYSENKEEIDKFLHYLLNYDEKEILLQIKEKMNVDTNWDKELDIKEWDVIEIEESSNGEIKVIELYFNNKSLQGEIPSEIGKLVNLQSLYLDNNQLTGEIPREICELVNLEELYLNDNQLRGEIPKEVNKLTNLKELKLNNNSLTGDILKEICKLVNLEELYLNNNNFTSEVPKEITKLINLETLSFD